MAHDATPPLAMLPCYSLVASALFLRACTSFVHPRSRSRFFFETTLLRALVWYKSWNSHQPRLGIAPLARFCGPMVRSRASAQIHVQTHPRQ